MEKTFKQQLENTANKNVLRYLVSKQMFCPITQSILDCRTAIMTEIYDKQGRIFKTIAYSPKVADRLANVKKALADQFHFTVKFYSRNKKIKSDLVQLLN